MMRCSIETRDRIFVKGYRFLSFARKHEQKCRQNLSKN